MDNKKIGKLIADLRKQKGMTQQELGDKIGVGFRAVSKWERGLTLPDIGNINELSKILGITSDELLSGKLNKENKIKKKLPSKVIKISISVITLIIIIISIFIYQNNKTYAYNISNTTDEYNVEGELIFRGSNISLVINELYFKETEFTSTIIKNYEYTINSGENYLFRHGYIYLPSGIEEPMSIKDFMSSFTINYNAETKIQKEKIINDGILINFVFLDENNNEINKEVKLSINQINKKN